MKGNFQVRFLEGGGAERLRLHSVRVGYPTQEEITMLISIERLFCFLVTGLGVLFLALTPIFAGDYVSRSGVEYMGAVLFLIFLGLLNLARLQSRHHYARTLALCGDGIALAYLLLAYVVIEEPAALGVALPVLGGLYRVDESVRAQSKTSDSGGLVWAKRKGMGFRDHK
jgi:hypothetical protein